MPPAPSAFLNGVPELLVLRLLRDREMYGYEIVQAIRAASGDAITFAEGVIYPLLHGLERDGALTTRRQTINGRSRVYYTVTPDGVGRLEALAEHWRHLNDAISGILAEPRHA
ncbi:PadR family transcriptional regulator [Devosia sp. 63-57]|uniref:PadR family transcriptional regulator n=1 Tax=Devosia sp. 63-57 TaxID=1895751 RepID=UPI0008693A7F|nr:PadR family transcriptional regulator [Devosia sp. 63-57]ODT50447.1 MAG: PadR family transcriptional regulator [Pelagibacterium sp. SCN 63-126]ODU88527.1 MAG: PadR family transcriptional regulator [Pelagibacterium sp. SCN 63-17]OJX45602.1 MAG: PadR family transcriptional regulator [Devosia sp. 63-57]